MNFGVKLKQLRQHRELSQPELADAAQIEQSYLSKLENGRSLPSAEVLARLMTALNLTMEELLDGIDGEEARSRLSSIPQIGTHLQTTAAAQLKHRRQLLIVSLVTLGLGFAVLVAGTSALLFPDVDYQYEYASTELVPHGESGQRYDSLEEFARYVIGERIANAEETAAGSPSFEVQAYREQYKYGDLRFPVYLLENEFIGTYFHRAADANEEVILNAAGFNSGGSRLFALSEQHAIAQPENGYLLFAGLLLLALGAAGLVYTLLSNALFRNK